MSADIGESVVPAFGAGVRLQFDGVRQAWVLLAPERLFLPDAQAVEILKLVDGHRDLRAIVDDLAARFDAPRPRIAGDVGRLLRELADKSAIQLGARQ